MASTSATVVMTATAKRHGNNDATSQGRRQDHTGDQQKRKAFHIVFRCVSIQSLRQRTSLYSGYVLLP